jgi:hypothetical protein
MAIRVRRADEVQKGFGAHAGDGLVVVFGIGWSGLTSRKCESRVFHSASHDGFIMLAVHRQGSTLHAHLGSYRGQHSRDGPSDRALSLPGAMSFMNMVTADLNGDGAVDLASQSNGSSDGVDLETGDGVLSTDLGDRRGGFAGQPTSYPTPQTSGRLVAGDFDEDGHPDLVFAGNDIVEVYGGLPVPMATNFALNFYRNLGDGRVAAPTSSPSVGGYMLVTGDFNGDGYLEVLRHRRTDPDAVTAIWRTTTEAGFVESRQVDGARARIRIGLTNPRDRAGCRILSRAVETIRSPTWNCCACTRSWEQPPRIMPRRNQSSACQIGSP